MKLSHTATRCFTRGQIWVTQDIGPNSREFLFPYVLFQLTLLRNWMHDVSPPRGLQSIVVLVQPLLSLEVYGAVHSLHQHRGWWLSCAHAMPLLVASAPNSSVSTSHP